MKKRSLFVVAMATLTALVGCQPSSSTSTSSSSSSSSSSTTTSTPPSSSSSSSQTTVAVTSVALALAKSTIEIGEKTQATATVLPENATDKTYSYTSSDASVATISATGEIVAIKAGKTTMTVTTKNGAKTASKELTVTAKVVKPVITFTGSTENLTVKAGAEIALPAFTATDYDGTDLTSSVEIEDYDDTKSITLSTKKFSSKIAGEHVIAFYVASAKSKLEVEETIVITVTAEKEETKDNAGYEDPAALKEYGTFKENFAKGINAPLYLSIGDTNNATSLTSTSDAIEGNSLQIDFNKTAGSALNSVFLQAFNQSFIRGKSTTYEVSFDYKVTTDNNNSNDVYFGLSWDDSTGINTQFANTNKTVNETYTFKQKFTETTVPLAGNAYFFFFKLGASDKPCVISIDNFVVTAKETASVNIVTPTSDQLKAGFTFDWKEKSNTLTKGETTIVNQIEDPTIREKIAANSQHFGEQVMHLTGADDHRFNGTTANNLIPGMKLQMSFRYYSVNDTGLVFIMMGAGNPSSAPTITNIGEGIKELTWEYKILSGQTDLNIYAQNNPSFNIYVGNLTMKLVEADPVPENTTPNGHEVGFTFTQDKRNWGDEAKPFGGSTYMDRPADIDAKMPAKVTKMYIDKPTDDANLEWFQAGGRLELNQVYEAKMIYYVAELSEGATLHLRVDGQFIPLDSTVGYHEVKMDYIPDHAGDFVNWYVNGKPSGILYLGSMQFTLKTIVK